MIKTKQQKYLVTQAHQNFGRRNNTQFKTQFFNARIDLLLKLEPHNCPSNSKILDSR